MAGEFFEDPTVSELVEANIKRVDKLSEQQQRKLLRIFRKVRQDLSDRLLTIPEGTFTEQQLNVTLVQIQAAIAAIKRDLKTGMVDSSDILSQRGIQDMVQEITRFSRRFEGSVQPIPFDPILVAIDSQNFLINKHEASIDAYGEDLRSAITTQLVSSLASRDTSERTVAQLRSSVGKFFLGEEFKLNRIVRTELQGIYNFSKLNGLQRMQAEVIPDLKKSLMHPIDGRTGDDSKQLAAKNPIVAIDRPFVFTFRRKLKSGEIRTERREFMFPPDRPNDRAILVPFRQEWDKRAAAFAA